MPRKEKKGEEVPAFGEMYLQTGKERLRTQQEEKELKGRLSPFRFNRSISHPGAPGQKEGLQSNGWRVTG